MAKSTVLKGSVHNLLFRGLVAAMTKFPLSSALAGSELVHMALENGVLLAHGGSLVRSKAQVKGEGAFDWISVDVRLLGPYALLVQSQVTIEVNEEGKEIRFTAGKQKLSIPYASGSPYTKPHGTRTLMTKELDDDDAKRLSYLSDVAAEDESRPDLNCVAIAPIDGAMKGIACNQRSVAVVQLGTFEMQGFIPLPVARVLSKGDLLSQISSADGQVAIYLKSLYGIHTAPLMDKNRDFPVAQASQFISASHIHLSSVDGDDFVKAFASCRDCLGFISKTGAFVELRFSGDSLKLNAKNGGGATFETEISAKTKRDEKIILPLDEVIKASPLFAGDKMSFGLGRTNGEVFIKSETTTVVVAPWKS